MKSDRCVFALLAFFCLFLTHRASAQTSVYGSAMFDGFGGTGGDYGNGAFKGNTGGFIAGAFYTFPSVSRFKAGIDGRITYSPGEKGGSAYTGALRVSFVPNHNRLRPYFQLGGGVVKTDLSTVTCDSYTCYGATCTLPAERHNLSSVSMFDSQTTSISVPSTTAPTLAARMAVPTLKWPS